MKTYSVGLGMTIRKHRVPVGAFYAMGETHVSEANVFDVYRHEAFISREETYEKALFTALLYAEINNP